MLLPCMSTSSVTIFLHIHFRVNKRRGEILILGTTASLIAVQPLHARLHILSFIAMARGLSKFSCRIIDCFME